MCNEHKSIISCNTTLYLSWLLHSEDALGDKFHTGGHKKLQSS